MLYGACDGVVPAPYAPFVEALGHLERVLDPDELREALGTSGAELTRLLPDLPVARGAGEGGPGHRASPPAHRRHRPADGGEPAPAGAARARGRALGRRPDALPAPPPGACGRQRAAAPARHLPRHRGRGCAVGRAGRPAAVRRRRAAAAGGADRRRGRRVRAPGVGRRRGRRARAGDQRADLGQPLPRLRAVALARRCRRAARRAGHARERARGRGPAARAPAAGDPRPARARRHRRSRVRARHAGPRGRGS